MRYLLGLYLDGDSQVSKMSSRALPADCTLLPLFEGELLVSRQHAVFCRVPDTALPLVKGVIQGDVALASVPDDLQDDLERHGFFGSPMAPEDDPPSVQLQLTNACNLACSYCCTNSGSARAEELTFERALAVVQQAREALGSGARIAILGGEPFLVPWAMDLAERTVDLELDLTVFTNGMLLRDEGLARRAAELTKRGAELRISLAGATAETCDDISGASRFADALEGMRQVVRHGGKLTVDLMLLPRNLDEVVRDFHALRQLLPEGTPVALGLAYLSGREEGQQIFSSRGDLEDALDRIAFESGEVITAAKRAPVTHRREGCGCAMGNHLHLRSDGALFTCFKMEEKVGDLSGEASFADAVRRVQQAPHPTSVLPRCADCPLATLCGGGCRSENLLYTGDPDEVLCDTWRVRVVSELLAEDRVTVVDWPIPHLHFEAAHRGIEVPEAPRPTKQSRHLLET